MTRLDSARFDRPVYPGRLTEKEKPALWIDGAWYLGREAVPARAVGTAGYVLGGTDAYLERLVRGLDVEALAFYQFKGTCLAPLAAMPRLRHLRVECAAKLTSLEWLRETPQLETLVLSDLAKVRDLGPVAALSDLRAFEFSGGMTKAATAASLSPIAELPRLAEIRLTNLKIEQGGLTPLTRCRALEELELSNQFDTSDYALLSVALPNARCDAFAPWRPFDLGNGLDRMITGKGKPFLSSVADAERIAKYERAFALLQEEHRRNLR